MLAMDNVELLLQKTVESVSKETTFLHNQHLLVVGKNMTGKTQFSKRLIKKLSDTQKDLFYYIGPYNRTIASESKTYSESKFSNFSVKEITTDRLDSTKDIFSKTIDGNDGPAIAYQELIDGLLLSHLSGGTEAVIEFTDETDITAVDYTSLLWLFLGLDVRKYEDNSFIGGLTVRNNDKIIINDDIDREINSLSSSEMTTARIVLEVLYAKKKDCKYVLIDEFDNYYDLENLKNFVEKLTSTFSTIRFILLVHNIEAIVRIKDMDVIIIQELRDGSIDASLHDANHIDSIPILDSLLSRRCKSQNATIDSFLGNCIVELLSNKKIDEVNLGSFLALEYSNLSTREKIMYDYASKLKAKYES